MKYDVIIPVAFKDFDFLKKSHKYLFKNLGAEHIFIITNGRLSRFLPSIIKNDPFFIVLDEDRLLNGLSFQKIHLIIKSQGREHTNTGWFFQQFLKMGFALSDYCKNDFYLSWDADTIPLQPISFFDEDEKPYFTMKTEYHRPYFIAIKRLLGIDKINDGSYIAEHMMFNKRIMCELLDKIQESSVDGVIWYEKILNSIVSEFESTDSFSEFETYGSFCKLNYPSLYVERQMPSFRRGGLIQGRFVHESVLQKLAEDFVVSSFEIYDRPPFPWNIMSDLYEKYLKHKGNWLKKYYNDD